MGAALFENRLHSQRGREQIWDVLLDGEPIGWYVRDTYQFSQDFTFTPTPHGGRMGFTFEGRTDNPLATARAQHRLFDAPAHTQEEE